MGHILLHDARVGKNFLVVTNNEPSELAGSLSLAILPRPSKNLEAREPRRDRMLPLQAVGNGLFRLHDRLPGYGVALYGMG